MKRIFDANNAKTSAYQSLCDEVNEKGVLIIGNKTGEKDKNDLAQELCKKNILYSLSRGSVGKYTWHNRLVQSGYLDYKESAGTEKNPPKQDKS